jgi:uncharacterized protein with HEPN domain
MSRHDPLVRVHHMLDYAREAVSMVASRERDALDTDRMLSLALVRLMEIVGEAASRLPDEFRSRYPQVPWRDISDLRNRLIHGYDTVNLDVLWTIAHDDFPPLIEQLERILEAEQA